MSDKLSMTLTLKAENGCWSSSCAWAASQQVFSRLSFYQSVLHPEFHTSPTWPQLYLSSLKHIGAHTTPRSQLFQASSLPPSKLSRASLPKPCVPGWLLPTTSPAVFLPRVY